MKRFGITALLVLAASVSAADPLTDVLRTMDRNAVGQCELLRLQVAYQRASSLDERRGLEQSIEEATRRLKAMAPDGEVQRFDMMVEALPEADKQKVREHMLRLTSGCYATLPPGWEKGPPRPTSRP